MALAEGSRPVLGAVLRHTATLGFVGYMPKAPGTFGTLVALVFVAVAGMSAPVYAAVTVFFIAVGTAASAEAERAFGSKDPGSVVIDEFAGYLVAAAFVPRSMGYLIAAFILFRLFDILKPPPIDRLQGIKGGAGIMADDIAAGVLSNVILQLWRALS